MPDNGASVNRGLLCPERFCPLLDLIDAAPRFERPDRPAHTYAQTTRRAWTARLQTKDAAPARDTSRDAA